MALPQNLTTNEVKNSAGTELEMTRIGPLDTNPRSVQFRYSSESPAFPIRLICSHQETGTGPSKVRSSLVRVNYSFAGQVDTTKSEMCSFYTVSRIPVGNMTSLSNALHANAMLMSFVASLGASTTILYDGTGYGSTVLVNGDS